MGLRPYQKDCIDRVFEQFDSGVRSTLAVAATGTGKTVIIGYSALRWINEQRPGRVLFLAHREELVLQAHSALERITGGRFEIEMGEYRASGSEQRGLMGDSLGTVASIASLIQDRRLKKHDAQQYGLVVIDEAHHAAPKCKTYRKLVEHYTGNPNVRLLGVTATPDRADEEALGQIFETCAFEYGVVDAIRDGWLVPIRQSLIHVEDLDFSDIETRCGDLSPSQLEEAISEEKILHRIVTPSIELIGREPTIVFMPGVESAHKAAEIFNRHRLGMAVALDGECEKDARKLELRRYLNGDVQVLVNCALFTEGTDLPRTRYVVMGRPTKSRSLYSQMVGRGTRILPGTIDHLFEASADERRMAIARSAKPDCTVIDFVGNSGKHKLIHAVDVLGGKISDDILEEAKAEVEKKAAQGLDVDALEALEEARKRAEERRQQARREIIAKARFSQRDVDPYDLFDVSAGREPGYLRGKKATEKQLAWLRARGIRNVDGLSLHKASALIESVKKREQSGLCTAKQAALLSAYGRPVDVTVQEASRLIAEINESIRKKPVEEIGSR